MHVAMSIKIKRGEYQEGMERATKHEHCVTLPSRNSRSSSLLNLRKSCKSLSRCCGSLATAIGAALAPAFDYQVQSVLVTKSEMLY